MSASILPGLNHVFTGLAITNTDPVTFYTADINGSQLIWVGGDGAVNAKFELKRGGTSYPITTLLLATAGEVKDRTLPGIPMIVGDELVVTAGADVSISAVIFENISGDRN